MLEEECHWGWALRFQKLTGGPGSPSLLAEVLPNKVSCKVKALVISFRPLHSSQFQRPEKEKQRRVVTMETGSRQGLTVG